MHKLLHSDEKSYHGITTCLLAIGNSSICVDVRRMQCRHVLVVREHAGVPREDINVNSVQEEVLRYAVTRRECLCTDKDDSSA